MDFIDQLRQFSERAKQIKDHLLTEEATKTSLIMPFFQLLGYDVFNPLEFRPELVADVGVKKGEKVDYAIYLNDKLCILIEAKGVNDSLNQHGSQLFRYFTTTPVKFGILTNGLVYRFYTDLEEPNKMDVKPFLELDLLNIKENLVPEVKKFTKSVFDVTAIFNAASELKYSYAIKQYLDQQIKEPSNEFTSHVVKSFYEGRMAQSVVEKFQPIVKKAFNQYVSEMMNDKISNALKVEKQEAIVAETLAAVPEEAVEENKIVTTEEEKEAYYVVKSILAEIIPMKRIIAKDTQNYFGILLDGKSNKWLCRLKLSDKRKLLSLPVDGKEERITINCVEDIFLYKQMLIDAAKAYEK